MMKKYFMMPVAVFCCVMATSFMTACGDEGDDNGKDTPTITVQAVQVIYDVKLAGNSEKYKSFTNYVNTTVEYLDENGQAKTETVSGLDWTKTVTLSNFPAKSSLKVQYASNGNSPTEEAVHVGEARNVSYYVVMSDGKSYKGSGSSSTPGGISISSDKFQTWLDRQNAKAAVTCTYKLNDDKTDVTEE
jgi:hypothetical protein